MLNNNNNLLHYNNSFKFSSLFQQNSDKKSNNILSFRYQYLEYSSRLFACLCLRTCFNQLNKTICQWDFLFANFSSDLLEFAISVQTQQYCHFFVLAHL